MAPRQFGDVLGQGEAICVYGATGFTGTLIARELRRLGTDLLIAGRNQDKLEALSEELGGVPSRAVPVDDDAGLREMLAGCSVVVACAGPFTLHGEAVVAAAADTGTHYLDTTGEQPFMRMVFDRYGERAEETGAALVSGMGFDYLPGDLIAALTAEGMGPWRRSSLPIACMGLRPPMAPPSRGWRSCGVATSSGPTGIGDRRLAAPTADAGISPSRSGSSECCAIRRASRSPCPGTSRPLG